MPAHHVKLLTLVAICAFLTSVLSGQTTISSVQLTVPMAEPPVIDGNVTAEEKGRSVSASLAQVGGLDKQVLYPTEMFVSVTVSGLYVGFISEEPTLDSIITNATRENGAVFNDDSVQVFLTPTMDTAADAYYHFAINPAGIRYSNHLITRETVSGWQSAVTKGEKKWQAEFFIPLASINAASELPMWRANFARVRPSRGNQPEEISAWVNPGVSLHNYKKFGYLTVPRFIPPAPAALSTQTATPVAIVTTTTVTAPAAPSNVSTAEAGAPQ